MEVAELPAKLEVQMASTSHTPEYSPKPEVAPLVSKIKSAAFAEAAVKKLITIALEANR